MQPLPATHNRQNTSQTCNPSRSRSRQHPGREHWWYMKKQTGTIVECNRCGKWQQTPRREATASSRGGQSRGKPRCVRGTRTEDQGKSRQSGKSKRGSTRGGSLPENAIKSQAGNDNRRQSRLLLADIFRNVGRGGASQWEWDCVPLAIPLPMNPTAASSERLGPTSGSTTFVGDTGTASGTRNKRRWYIRPGRFTHRGHGRKPCCCPKIIFGYLAVHKVLRHTGRLRPGCTAVAAQELG